MIRAGKLLPGFLAAALCLALLLPGTAFAKADGEKEHKEKPQAVRSESRSYRSPGQVTTREQGRPSYQRPGPQAGYGRTDGNPAPGSTWRGPNRPGWDRSSTTSERRPTWTPGYRPPSSSAHPPATGWRPTPSSGNRPQPSWRPTPSAGEHPQWHPPQSPNQPDVRSSWRQPSRTDRPTEVAAGWRRPGPDGDTPSPTRPGWTRPDSNGTLRGHGTSGWTRPNRVTPPPRPPAGWTAAQPNPFSGDKDYRHQHHSIWGRLLRHRHTWGDPGYYYWYRPFGHPQPIGIHYYYPSYCYRPGPIVFCPARPYYVGYYPAPFCTYGWFSFWLPSTVVVIERVVDDDYWTDRYDYQPIPEGARRAMADIRDAWLDDRPELIQDHLRQYGKVRIFFRGHYAYSITGEDYYDMLLDAFSTLDTARFELGRMKSRGGDEAFVSARHEFVAPDGRHRTVQLGYTLRLIDGYWYITAVDSSSDYLDVRDHRD